MKNFHRLQKYLLVILNRKTLLDMTGSNICYTFYKKQNECEQTKIYIFQAKVGISDIIKNF